MPILNQWKEMFNKTPDHKKTVKVLFYQAGSLLLLSVASVVLISTNFFDRIIFGAAETSYVFLIFIFTLSAILFAISAILIKRSMLIGTTIAQISIMVLAVLFPIFLYFLISALFSGQLNNKNFQIMLPIVFVVSSFQVFIPAFYAIRYLQRLKKLLKTDSLVPETEDDQITEKTFHEALFPFGATGNFICIMAVGFLVILFFHLIDSFFENNSAIFGLSFLFLFSFLFFGPIWYNTLPSKFEKIRNKITEFKGGGSIHLINGSWPFFKLIIYKDGVELRVVFNRFFIPYQMIKSVKKKFFIFGISIISDVKGVPSTINFSSSSNKKVLELINTYKNAYLEGEN